ncbi:MFS transporter [Mucilaginibacter myungsuensis]|uniref:MFS transporter n=1 Tax=Mucilaginibacter myungsuensis TaxID=649104 RepID=A0A929KUX1_9SPHI|nr:MFS transporter [Mucilaginibacter myungsuensis]MBE9661202.1 MFS transporter [Mucilaginibacter myungsuensis]MDN3597347.1 MFS transporter [Mucilaginibacter myungsuensis]
MPALKLPFGKQIAYASGMIGWSIMTNIIIVMLPYFYLPPSNAGLVPLLPQIMLLGVLNLLPVIAAAGRVVDAVFDPFIASVSDKSTNPGGRRIPFMKWAILPSVFFCCLVFFPVVKGESMYNAYALTIGLMLFFMSLTTYIIPYNALLPTLTDTSAEKVKLSSYQQVGFILGMIIAGLVNNYAKALQNKLGFIGAEEAVQYTIWALCVFAGIMMLIPVLAIDERKYSNDKPTHLPLLPAIRKTFSNPNFKYYLISDFSFYMALSIISSGLMYFVTVLLDLPATQGGVMMGVMVGTSLLFYPAVIYLSKKFGKKPLVIFSFALLSLIFVAIYFLGELPFAPKVQLYAMGVAAACPLAALGILPNAILAEIAERDAEETGENSEGMFFAVKYLFVKLGQSLGIALFAFLTIYGKDPGNDYGLRMNGICGFMLCVVALLVFTRFKEPKEQGK